MQAASPCKQSQIIRLGKPAGGDQPIDPC